MTGQAIMEDLSRTARINRWHRLQSGPGDHQTVLSASRYPHGEYWYIASKPCNIQIPYQSQDYFSDCDAQHDNCLRPSGMHCQHIFGELKPVLPKKLLVGKVHFGPEHCYHAVIVGPLEELGETERVEFGKRLDDIRLTYCDFLNSKAGPVLYGINPGQT